MANIFDTVRSNVESLRKKAQIGIQNWATQNPQTAQRIINAPKQYTNVYSKVSPYVPFAPKVNTPQQIQQNKDRMYQAVNRFQPVTLTKNTTQNVLSVPYNIVSGLSNQMIYNPKAKQIFPQSPYRQIQQIPKPTSLKDLTNKDFMSKYNKDWQDVFLNTAIGMIAPQGKSKKLLLDEDVKEIGNIANRASKRWFNQVGKIDLTQMTKDENLVNIIFQKKYNAPISELKKIPLEKKINSLFGIAMEDYRGAPRFQPGLSTRELGGVVPQSSYKQKSNLLTSLTDRLLTSSRASLQKMGKGGGDLANKIDTMYNTAERLVGKATNDYRTVTSQLDDVGIEKVNRFLNGDKINLTQQEQQAVKPIRAMLDAIWNKAKSIGLNPGKKENYFPNIPDINKIAANPDFVADYLVKTKQAPNIAKARAFIDDLINGVDMETAFLRFKGTKPKVSGFLEKQRLIEWPTDVIRLDKGVITDYFENTFNRLSQVEQLGKDNEIGKKILLELKKEGYDATTAEEILRQNLGITPENPTVSKGLGIARSVQALFKMPLGAVTNASQSINTATIGGTRRTAGQIFKYFFGGKPAQEQIALRSGAITESVLNDIMKQWRGESAISKLAAPGFKDVEKFNRIISANVGKDYASNLTSQLKNNPNNQKVIKNLEELVGKFNVDEVLKNGLSEEQLNVAAQSLTNLSQFKTRPIDMPISWNSSGGKTITQFKQFAFKQALFVRDQILKPATKGNFGPLARYILLSLIIGEGVQQVKGAIKGALGTVYQTAKTGITQGRLPTGEELKEAYTTAQGKPRPTDLLSRGLQNIKSVGSFGLVSDALSTLEAAGQYGEKAILEFIVGPTLSDLSKLGTNVAELTQGKPRNLVRNTIRDIPFFGQPIANIEYPKKEDQSMSLKDRFEKIKTGFELEPYKLQQQNIEVQRGNTVLKIFDEVKDLSVEQAKKVLLDYKEKGILTKDMYSQSLLPKLKEYKQGISPSEKSIKNLGVDSEAKYHYDKTRKMSLEEKKNYLMDLKKRGLLTKPTYLQFLKLERLE